MRRYMFWVLVAVLVAGFASPAWAARIGDISDNSISDQALRFFTFKDPSVRYALIGSLLLGISCGLLGSFVVVRKMALMGDTLSHAVLPGVALGFLWNMSKDPLAIFVGATVAGLLGTTLVGIIKDTTKLREDTTLGMVLASFFAIGTCLVTMIQGLPTANKSGLDQFLFGQAAAIGEDDVRLMAAITVLAVVVIVFFYKEFLVTCFDSGFGRAAGFPVRWIHHVQMLLLAFAVVIALQAVGVVLVSAMLITPAATAYLLTDRMHWMLVLAAVFGMVSGAVGAFCSFLGPSLPTGPFMVLAASGFFGLTFLMAPRHGVVMRWWRRRSRARRIQRENTLKSVYQVLEDRDFAEGGVLLNEVAERRREPMVSIKEQARRLYQHGLATMDPSGQRLLLTPEGWQLASSIVRNHRLWELYLTNAANIAADHVHEDAEKIEHVLGEAVVRQLEKRLDYARQDPHGRPIPGPEEIQRGAAPSSQPSTTGYRRKQ